MNVSQSGNFYSSSVGMGVEMASGLRIEGMVEGASALRANGAQSSLYDAGFLDGLSPLARRIRKHCGSIMCHGNACTQEQFKIIKEFPVWLMKNGKAPSPITSILIIAGLRS